MGRRAIRRCRGAAPRCGQDGDASRARSVIAQITGHSVICDRAPHRSGLWDAVTDMWCALLPAIATDTWLANWDAPTWSDRPRPELVTALHRPTHTEVHAIIE